MRKKICYIAFLLVSVSFSQSTFESFLKPSDSLNLSRRNAVVIAESSLAGLTLIGLDRLWYADYPRSKFHTLNDNNEWLQMDKLGHVFTSYQLGRVGANVLNWSGVRKKDQLIYGSTLGFTFLTAVEVMDGFSEEWGFSWGDMIANATGTGLYVGQELLWQEQRIVLKYSFHQTKYAAQRPDKLGDGFFEEFLKDYNGQTYWLSANVHSFFKDSNFPKWLNVAIGYGGDGMLSGENESVNNSMISQNRIRQFYLSLDVDLSRIKTNSRFLRTIFDVFNVIKVPFPALEFTDKNGIKLHGIYF
ncbi:DUF2279 domain-containing protein [Meridianimaribacter sp. CL38]|uniref:DUF2279 domain-containing protein n=1 Tax=Meridianimaribacter sp. CL38 TaxID=2213021 RepID=UPI001039D2C6|nr:DUF2279 domain-containing protein [Meridianimaribacter sp. CL38]TBV26968.1 DUF2279 domain-containing protein [Meridianimaribacter sp. CL38]